MFDLTPKLDVVYRDAQVNVKITLAAILYGSCGASRGLEVIMIADNTCFVEFGDCRSDGSIPFHGPRIVPMMALPKSVVFFSEAFRLILVANVQPPA